MEHGKSIMIVMQGAANRLWRDSARYNAICHLEIAFSVRGLLWIEQWPKMLPDLQLNDLLRLRKPHPCGSYEWTVVRLGADIGIECKGCGHRVLLTRRELAKRMKANLTRRDEHRP